jgi:hypothetical protein
VHRTATAPIAYIQWSVPFPTPSRRPWPIGCSSAPDIERREQREHHPYTYISSVEEVQQPGFLAAARVLHIRASSRCCAERSPACSHRAQQRCSHSSSPTGRFSRIPSMRLRRFAIIMPRKRPWPRVYARRPRALDISHRFCAFRAIIRFSVRDCRAIDSVTPLQTTKNTLLNAFRPD